MSTICIRCSTSEHTLEFPTLKEYVEHDKSGHKIMPKVSQVVLNEIKEEKKQEENPSPAQPLSSSQPPKPILLSYKFTGQCPVCNNEVRTIEVHAGENLICTAYCNSCDKTLMQEEVIPIQKQKHKNEDIPKRKQK